MDLVSAIGGATTAGSGDLLRPPRCESLNQPAARAGRCRGRQLGLQQVDRTAFDLDLEVRRAASSAPWRSRCPGQSSSCAAGRPRSCQRRCPGSRGHPLWGQRSSRAKTSFASLRNTATSMPVGRATRREPSMGICRRGRCGSRCSWCSLCQKSGVLPGHRFHHGKAGSRSPKAFRGGALAVAWCRPARHPGRSIARPRAAGWPGSRRGFGALCSTRIAARKSLRATPISVRISARSTPCSSAR